MRQSGGSPGIRRAAIALAVVALSFVVAMPAVASAATSYRSTLRITKRVQSKAGKTALTGVINRKAKGHSVTVEVRKPGRAWWTPASSRTITKYGTWKYNYYTRVAGRYYFRIRYGTKKSRLVGVTVRHGSGIKKNIILYSTTSVRDAGIWNALKPMFLHDNPEYTMDGAQWLGTGQSLTNGAELGMADVILAHAPSDEVRRVSQGYAKNRKAVMFNYFEVVGPKTGGPSIAADALPSTAFQAIATWNDNLSNTAVPFWSRSDDSGTNQAELAYWAAIGNPQYSSGTTGKSWYAKRNAGMGKILNDLNAASLPGGYTLADNATYTFQSNTWTTGGVTNNLKIIAARKSAEWKNLYSVLEVVRARNPEGAADFSAWIRTPGAQSVIQEYGKISFPTEQLFYPNAGAY
jgi:tungstate transport system substrate-binding protein